MNTCPHCYSNQSQVKAGRNPSGSQRYLCNNCDRTYTPTPNHRGHPNNIRYQAIELYHEGHSFRAVARELGVGTQSVINWVRTKKEIQRKHKQTCDAQHGGNNG